jgi:hypothetical protein
MKIFRRYGGMEYNNMLFFEFPLYGDFFLKTQKNKVKM